MNQWIVFSFLFALAASLEARKADYTYYLVDGFQKYRSVMIDALDELESKTCLTFTEKRHPRAEADLHFVAAPSRHVCYTKRGIKEKNHIFHFNHFCFNKGIIQKEMVIALGYDQRVKGLPQESIDKIMRDFC